VQEEIDQQYHGHNKLSIETTSTKDELSLDEKELIASATLHVTRRDRSLQQKQQKMQSPQSLVGVPEKMAGAASGLPVDDEDAEDELSEEDKALIAAAGAGFNQGFKKSTKKQQQHSQAIETAPTVEGEEMVGAAPVSTSTFAASSAGDNNLSDPEHLQEQLDKITEQATDDAVKTVIGDPNAAVSAVELEKPENVLKDVETSQPSNAKASKEEPEDAGEAVVGHALYKTEASKTAAELSPDEARKIVYGNSYDGDLSEAEPEPYQAAKDSEAEDPDFVVESGQESRHKLQQLDAKAQSAATQQTRPMTPQEKAVVNRMEQSVHLQAQLKAQAKEIVTIGFE